MSILQKKLLTKKNIGIFLVLIVAIGLYQTLFDHSVLPESSFSNASQGYVKKYSTIATLKDGSKVYIVPISNSQKDQQSNYKIMKDHRVTITHYNRLPWTDQMIEGNFRYHVLNWQIFDDLTKSNETPDIHSFEFLAYSEKGEIMGKAGIQKSTRQEEFDEINFSTLDPYRKKGLATVLCTYIMEFYQKQFGKKSLEAIILPYNSASKALIARLRFKPRLDKNGKIMTHHFPHWNNTTYEIYRYNPDD